MLVRMLQHVTGGHGRHKPGAVVDLPGDVAAAWVLAGVAETAEMPEPAEAAQPVGETASIEAPSYAAFTRERRARKR